MASFLPDICHTTLLYVARTPLSALAEPPRGVPEDSSSAYFELDLSAHESSFQKLKLAGHLAVFFQQNGGFELELFVIDR